MNPEKRFSVRWILADFFRHPVFPAVSQGRFYRTDKNELPVKVLTLSGQLRETDDQTHSCQ